METNEMVSTVRVGAIEYTVTVTRACAPTVLGEGMVSYGGGDLIVKGGCFPTMVSIIPEGMNGIYVSLVADHPAVMSAAARWAIVNGLRDDTGRITEAGRTVLYATVEPVADTARVARRVKMNEAKRHFNSGGEVLVSERGHELELPVHRTSTTHTSSSTTWAELTATVREWRNRYPNQRFYVV